MRDDDAYLLRDLHPEIPWIEIVGMRNRLVHAYFEVDVELLWETVQRDIPKLISLIEPLCRRKNRRVERSRRGQHRSALQGVPDRGPGLRPPLRRRAVRRGPASATNRATSGRCARASRPSVRAEVGALSLYATGFHALMSGEAPRRWRDCSPRPAWGKFRDGTGEFHPLEHHSADVAACFEALLRDPVLRDRFEQASGEEGFSRLTEARLCLIAFLHDFGKLNVGFQFDVLSTNSGAPNKVHHIKAALWACERMEVLEALGLLDMAAWGAEALEEYLRAALAHHGIPARSLVSGRGPDHIWRRFGDYDPITGAQLLARRGREWFPQAFETGPNLPRSPALAHLFAGVLTLADQLGSNGEFFAFCPTADPHYLERARQRARRAVAESGFRRDGWADDATPADFATTGDYRTVFDFDSPRPLQREVADAPIDCPLLILESETGSGKTEAALIRFAKLWRAGRVDGLYFALPTRGRRASAPSASPYGAATAVPKPRPSRDRLGGTRLSQGWRKRMGSAWAGSTSSGEAIPTRRRGERAGQPKALESS